MKEKWTPGPWQFVGYWPDGEWCVESADKFHPIMYKAQGEQTNFMGNEADARLIAAAPALVEMLENVLSLYEDVASEHDNIAQTTIDEARALLAGLKEGL